jgi:colanic acid biosynthesis glycosyl transferase WcaI
MTRVLLLNQYYAPDEAATAQMAADLGEGLAAAGCEVVAVCGDRSYGDPSKRYPAREVINGVAVRRARTTGFGRGSFLARVADYVTFIAGAKMQLLFGPAPDVVISLSTPPFISLVGTIIGRIRGAKTVFWSMDVYPDVAYELGAVRRGSLAGLVIGALARATHGLPDLCVALGDTMKRRLLANGARNVAVIHNWSDGDAIRPLPTTDNPLRRDWSWRDRFVLMYSGNLGLGHEFETALAGLRIADRGLRIEGRGLERAPLLSFVGTGPRLTEVKARAVDLGLFNPQSAIVEFRPYVPRHQLAHSLTAPDVHLVTMRENMPGLIVPSKIYGILAAGRPTIYVGPAEGEIHDILTSGSCGIHVPIGDPDAFAAAVNRYRDDPALVAAHGANARRLFDERFTRERGVREWIEAIGAR